MLKVIEIEAKTLQEATKKASDILKISENKIKLEVLKEKKGILRVSRSTLQKASPNIDIAIEGQQYLDNMVTALGIDVKMEVQSSDESTIPHRLQTSDHALLIGKE